MTTGSMAENDTTEHPTDLRKRIGKAEVEESSNDAEARQAKFLVSYRSNFYDIQDFMPYHPGGKKVLSYFKNRSLDQALDEYPHSKAAFHLLEEYTLKNQEKYQEYEEFIDWDAPIADQVGNLGDRYWTWVNLPVNRDVRLFQSDTLEKLSITPWYVIPIVWVPIILYFFHTGWIKPNGEPTGMTLIDGLISWGLGLLLWTLVEYVLHRKLFHFKPPATSKLLISLHFALHGVHHKAPFDSRRLVFPPLPALLIAFLLWYLYEALFPQSMVNFIVAGTVTGYLFYDLTHYYLHHGAPKDGSYFYVLKRHHNYHHFLHHDLGFGVCSKMWDGVFGTSICLRKLTKPIEW